MTRRPIDYSAFLDYDITSREQQKILKKDVKAELEELAFEFSQRNTKILSKEERAYQEKRKKLEDDAAVIEDLH